MRRLSVAVAAALLLSTPAFGDGHMAKNLGVGRETAGGEAPPKPRARPSDEYVAENWRDRPRSKEQREWLNSPEGQAARDRIGKMLRRLAPPEMLPPSSGKEI